MALLLPAGLLITKVLSRCPARSPVGLVGCGPGVRGVRVVGLSAGLFPWRGKSALIGEGNCLGAVACLDLGEQVVDVALDGAFADDELFGDLVVRHAGGDQ